MPEFTPQHLSHPELFDLIPVVGDDVADIIDQRAHEVASMPTAEENVTVVIRSLNEAGPLDSLLKDIERNIFSSEVQIIVVDNESSDDSSEVAKSHGAEVINLPRGKFTHPYSLNLGMRAAAYNTVLLTVAHANLTNTQTLAAASNIFNDPDNPNAAGAFGTTVPHLNASRTERLVALGTPMAMSRKTNVQKAGLGVLGATNALVSKDAWKELGYFDERYERGGEDTLIAQRMLDAGMTIVHDPALSVHHTHGLGPINYGRQVSQWTRTLRRPEKFDPEQWARRRPDLNMFE